MGSGHMEASGRWAVFSRPSVGCTDIHFIKSVIYIKSISMLHFSSRIKEAHQMA